MSDQLTPLVAKELIGAARSFLQGGAGDYPSLVITPLEVKTSVRKIYQ